MVDYLLFSVSLSPIFLIVRVFVKVPNHAIRVVLAVGTIRSLEQTHIQSHFWVCCHRPVGQFGSVSLYSRFAVQFSLHNGQFRPWIGNLRNVELLLERFLVDGPGTTDPLTLSMAFLASCSGCSM